MLHEFSRTEMLIGPEGLARLKNARVAIFGIGGVGAFAAEALARSGVGSFVLVDDDCVCLTNINRQLHATRSTVGQPKVAVMKARILDINPQAEVTVFQSFYLPENAHTMIAEDYDYILDAVDTVTAKIDLAVRANQHRIPLISSMGAGNKLDPTQFEVTDIYNTTVCPLARVMRSELRKRGVQQLKVVFSREKPMKPAVVASNNCQTGCICPTGTTRTCTTRNHIPGSVAFVPSVAGLIMAGEVIKDLAFQRL